MMAGNPNWWSIGDMHQQNSHPQHQISSSHLSTASSQYLYGSSSLSSLSSSHHQLNQDFPVRSWSRLLLGGYGGDEDRFANSLLEAKKLENWEEEQVLNTSSFRVPADVDVKQESSNFYSRQVDDDQFQACKSSNWLPVSSPNSCVTSLSNSILNFSTAKGTRKNQNPDKFNSSECNSSNSTGGVSKKPRVQQSSTQPALKVRKEKLGDRITTLHQLVSPFGKTDTASVLSESIGYIRFLQAQIEALCSPYMRNNTSGHQQSGNDLRSKGLCLVPLSFTQHVGHDINGASNCWTPSLGGGF